MRSPNRIQIPAELQKACENAAKKMRLSLREWVILALTAEVQGSSIALDSYDRGRAAGYSEISEISATLARKI